MSTYTKALIIANLFSFIAIVIVGFSIRKNRCIDDGDDKISIFEEAVIKSAKELSAGQEKEMICPLCGHSAVIGSSPYNGYIYGQCDFCNTGFIKNS